MRPAKPKAIPDRRMRGFEPAFGLMAREVRTAGESRGFAVAKLLTHWEEVAGKDLASVTRPVKVGYGREGMGASLTLLVRGAAAPMVEMQKEVLRERVNAVYGYNAIVRILLTQTAATGFAEGQAQFLEAPKAPQAPDPKLVAEAQQKAKDIADDGLRAALERLGQNILTRQKAAEGKR